MFKRLTEKLILGTAQLGMKYGINNQTGKPSMDSVMEILSCAAGHGIDTLDTAAGYGDAEKVIARFHQENDAFKIIAKFASGEGFSIKKECERVTQLLSISYLECFMHHRWSDVKDELLMRSLIDLKKARQIKKLGVSVYNNDQLEEAASMDWIDVIQVPFNLLDNISQRGACLRKAKENGKEIHCRSVFLQGLFFMNIELLPEKLKPLSIYLTQLNTIAVKADCSLGALALQYALKNKLIDRVVMGVEQKNQLENNFKMINENIDESVFKVIDSIKVKEINLLSPINW